MDNKPQDVHDMNVRNMENKPQEVPQVKSVYSINQLLDIYHKGEDYNLRDIRMAMMTYAGQQTMPLQSRISGLESRIKDLNLAAERAYYIANKLDKNDEHIVVLNRVYDVLNQCETTEQALNHKDK